MQHLAVSLLGPLRIEVGGRPLASLRSTKARALLVYLATEQGRSHRRATLADLLWPDRDEQAARHDLSQALWTLQRAIGDLPAGSAQAADPLFKLSRDTVALVAGAHCWVDVAAFVAALDSCAWHHHRATDCCDRCGRQWEEAVALYRGDFLADLALPDSAPFEEWAASTRSSLRQRVLTALLALIGWHEQRGDGDEAIRVGRRLLELEPWHEEGHRRLLRALATSGQRSVAMAEHERFRLLLAHDLGCVPEAETSALVEGIRRGDFTPGRSERPARRPPASSRLPALSGLLIARERELAALLGMVANPECRLITLVGPGGIGKTRLALQVAIDKAASFSDGACLVSLAPMQSAGRLAPEIAVALGIDVYGGHDPEEQLLDDLANREALLVLDNFEHLLEGGAELVAAILRRAPGVKILVTSRERLRLHDEWLFSVDGLSVPTGEDAAAVARSGAARLFVTSALKAKADLSLRTEDWPAVARICRLVGGMPLGIELAAAWVPVLACADIAREIEKNLDFLATELRDVPARHRSMRAVFDHSWALLSSQQRDVFKRLSVFSGGFDRPAAEEVAGATLATLASLVGTSFVQPRPGGRYELHELLRQYGAFRLGADEEDERQTRDRHCDYYVGFLKLQESRLKGRDQASAMQAIGRDLENVRAAWRWAAEHGHAERIAESSFSLCLFFAGTGRVWEAERFFSRMAALLESAPLAAGVPRAQRDVALGWALITQGGSCYRLGKFQQARDLLERSASIFRDLDARADLGFALHHLAGAVHLLGEYDEERRLLEESIVLLRGSGDLWTTAYSLNDLGRVARLQGDLDEAQRLSEESLATFRTFEDQRGVAFALDNLGVIAAARGDEGLAVRLHEECLVLRRANGDGWGTAATLTELGALALRRGELRHATACLTEAADVATRYNVAPIALGALTELATVYARLGKPTIAEEVVAFVLQHPALTPDTSARVAAVMAELRDAGEPATQPASPDLDPDATESLVRRVVGALSGPAPTSRLESALSFV